MIKISAKLD